MMSFEEFKKAIEAQWDNVYISKGVSEERWKEMYKQYTKKNDNRNETH